jgi:hypothetical protein
MNYKFAAATLVLAGALGAAGCSHNNNPQQGPASNASTQLPQTPPYSATTAAHPMGTPPAAGTSGAAGTGTMAGPTTPFNDLAGSKGYITQQDAQRDAWLGTHFSACDSDHDGKLTQQEYTQCTQHAGATAPEGVPASASSVH